MGHAIVHLEVETWNSCSERCRNRLYTSVGNHLCFSISAVQGISDIYLEGSEGNYRRVQTGIKGKGLKCVGNWVTLVLLLMA